jgi:hypothetical protein
MEIRPNVSSPLAASSANELGLKIRQTNLPGLPIMAGDQWNEFIRLLTPEEQQVFMVDVWKLINLYCRRIGGD